MNQGWLPALIVGAFTFAGVWVTVWASRRAGQKTQKIDAFKALTGTYDKLLSRVQAQLDEAMRAVEELQRSDEAKTERLKAIEESLHRRDAQLRQQEAKVRAWARWAAQVVALLKTHGIAPPPLPSDLLDE